MFTREMYEKIETALRNSPPPKKYVRLFKNTPRRRYLRLRKNVKILLDKYYSNILKKKKKVRTVLTYIRLILEIIFIKIYYTITDSLKSLKSAILEYDKKIHPIIYDMFIITFIMYQTYIFDMWFVKIIIPKFCNSIFIKKFMLFIFRIIKKFFCLLVIDLVFDRAFSRLLNIIYEHLFVKKFPTEYLRIKALIKELVYSFKEYELFWYNTRFKKKL